MLFARNRSKNAHWRPCNTLPIRYIRKDRSCAGGLSVQGGEFERDFFDSPYVSHASSRGVWFGRR